MVAENINIPVEVSDYAMDREKSGNTAVFAAIDGKIAGIFSIADQIREDAPRALSEMKKNGIKKIIMLTGLKILSEFSERLEASEKQTTRFATEKVETRIALFLAECIGGKEESMEFILPMSKKDLASYLGTTPETISRKLTDLEDAGYIKQMPHRKIKILDLDGLLLQT